MFCHVKCNEPQSVQEYNEPQSVQEKERICLGNDCLLLLPHIVLQNIFKYSTVSALINLACCSFYCQEILKEFIWFQVNLLGKDLIEDLSKDHRLANLFFTSDLSVDVKRGRDEYEYDEEEIKKNQDTNLCLVISFCENVTKLKLLSINAVSVLVDFHYLTEVFLKGDAVQDQIIEECCRFFEVLKSLHIDPGYASHRFTSDGLKNIGNLQHLEKLTIYSSRTVCDLDFSYISSLPKLRELYLRNMYVTDVSIAHLRKTNLEKLSIKETVTTTYSCFSNPYSTSNLSSYGLQHICDISSLTELYLLSSDKIADDGFAFLHKLPNLRVFECEDCKELTNQGVKYICDGLPNLEILSLRLCARVGDKGVYHIAKLNNLRVLNLSRCCQLTGWGLHHLRSLTNLRRLDVTGCPNVHDPDLPNVEVVGRKI